MVTMQQFQNGVARYIDADILPHLSGVKRLAVGTYAGLAANNVGELLTQYKDHPAVSVMKVMDKDGNVDIDRLYSAAAPMFANGQKFTIHIPMVGDMTVDSTDLDKLYQYILG